MMREANGEQLCVSHRGDFETFGNYFAKDMERFRMVRALDTCRNIREFCGALCPNRVLEVGCGDGVVLQVLGDAGFGKELYGLEVSNTGLEATAERKIENLREVRLFNGYDIPYPDRHFDLVLLPLVLEYVEDPRRLLREMARVACHLYIQVQLYDVSVKRNFAPDQFHTLNWYTERTLRLQLQSSGLRILRMRSHNPVVETYTLLNSKPMVGRLKWFIKEAGLRMAPWLARRLWNYQCAALCVASEGEVQNDA